MLLVHPIREVIRFLPVLIVFAVARTASGGETWQLLGIAIPIGLGVMRYLTTRFRITAGRIELRRGLLNRHVLSTPVDRVRTVDLTSSPIHRLLGLTKVRIGTGTASTSDEDRIDLDGLPLDRARALREELLHDVHGRRRRRPRPPPERAGGDVRPRWVRFAPLTGSGVVIGAAALGAASQLLQAVGFWERFDPESVDVPGVSAGRAGPPAGARLSWSSSRCSRSAATWSPTGASGSTRTPRRRDLAPDPRPVHHPRDHAGRRPRGRRQPLRAARPPGCPRRAALGHRHRARPEAAGQLDAGPARPAAVVERVAREVLDTPARSTPRCARHGPRAARRRWTRALVPTAPGRRRWRRRRARCGAPCVAARRPGRCSRWPPLLALDRVRSLGPRAGRRLPRRPLRRLVRRRRILEVDHVIGWNFRSTWFQRRAGLTTLVATTAGGTRPSRCSTSPRRGVRVAHAALPDLVAQFRA